MNNYYYYYYYSRKRQLLRDFGKRTRPQAARRLQMQKRT